MTRAQQKEQTSKAILNASLIVFSKMDYNTATFTDISKIAKVTNGLIVQRFGSKEALYTQLINEIIVNNFPNFDKSASLYDALIEIVEFIKEIGGHSIDEVKFCNTIFKNIRSIPFGCRELIERLFTIPKLRTIFENEVEKKFINGSEAFDMFINFFTNCCDLTTTCIDDGEELPSNETYIQLFKKLDAVHQAKSKHSEENAVFENISDKSLKLYNIGTWYAEISEDRDPSLYFPKEVLLRAGLEGNESPSDVYKFILEHVDTEDAPVVKDAIHRMFHGQYVEFEYRWCTPSLKTVYYRCSGKRTIIENGVTRFEGILQNITSFKTLRNRNKIRNFFLSLVAPDYEYVSYVHLGQTPDDDFAEDYKSSEFLNKLTENWEHNNNLTDRFNIFFNKVLTGVDRDRFFSLDNRQVILDSLKKNDRYKTSFKIRHFGVSYHYEVVFFPDRDDDKTIVGLVCGIRLANNISNSMLGKISDCTDSENTKDKIVNDLILDNYEAGFIVNLKDHTFEIIRENDHFNRRNSYIPDFESFIKSYIKRDVYFEDVDKLIDATTFGSIKINLDKQNYFTMTYRDISRGDPRYFLIRMTKGENNLVAILINDIHIEYTSANHDKQKLEEELRTKDLEISSKNSMIENINSVIVELLGDVIESQRKDGIKDLSKFKYLTYILGCQLMEDYPELDLTRESIAQIGEASVLHDIGKITIPDAILYKDGKLTKEEFDVIKTHTSQDEKILSKLKAIYDKTFYDLIITICKYHHERFDGTGYPEGLKGNEIPLSAQIVGLVDAFAALISKRTYRSAYQTNFAYEMIVSGKCGSFNPILIESFKHCYDRLANYAFNGAESDTFEMNKLTRDSFKINTIINNQTLPIISTMAEQMPSGFFMYKNDAQGTLIYFNDVMVKFFNCADREDFIKYVNNSFKGLVRVDDYDKTINSINAQNSNPDDSSHIQYRIVCKNGEEKILDHYGHISHSDAFGEVYYAFVKDITDDNKPVVQEVVTSEEPVQKPYVDNGARKERVKTLEGTRILIVDDNDLSRFMTKDTLEEEGAHVSDFASAKEALETIKQVKPFDIVLVDLVMPEMNGVDLTRAIREWEEDKDTRVPIVAVTGEVGSDLAKECIEEGANGCMSKPLIIPELARILILSMKEHASKMDRKLTSTIQKANTDVLTNVKNRTAFAERLEQIEQLLKNDPYYEFGIVGADVNNLKYANDTFGHDVGDIYIKNCCQMLTDTFMHSTVYRTGGDEFSVILEGTDLIQYKKLMARLKEMNIEHSAIQEYEKGRAHIAMGIAIYNPEIDLCIDDVIKRADEVMYKNKEAEKARVAGSFSR